MSYIALNQSFVPIAKDESLVKMIVTMYRMVLER